MPTLTKRPALLRHVLALGWAAAAATSQHNERKELKTTPLVETRLVQSAPGQAPKRTIVSNFARGVVSEARRRLLNDWTINGKRLGECTRVELFAAAAKDGASGRGMLANEEFYTNLGNALPDDKTKAKALDDATLETARNTSFGYIDGDKAAA